jgi:antirestriction protein ArdC
MTVKKDIYESVTQSVVALLESGVEPWRKPWKSTGAGPLALPVNAATGRAYRGINIPLLWAAGQQLGYESNGWLTYKQAQGIGAQVRRGEKATPVVFWKFVEKPESDEDGEKSFAFARYYFVFNVAQVDGLPESKAAPAAPIVSDNVIDVARAAGAEIRYGGDRAFYVPSADVIRLPNPEQFESRASFQATALHELTHWTGHESRLDRKFGARFGDEAYAFEELVAELGSAFLSATLGVENAPLEHHASYVDNWLRVLQSDKRAIFTAASQAQKAADFVIEAAAPKEEALAA